MTKAWGCATLVALVSCVVLLACDDEPAAPVEPAENTAAESEGSPSVEEERSTTEGNAASEAGDGEGESTTVEPPAPRPPPPAMTKADARAYRREIASARAKTQQDQAEGLGAFMALIEAHPQDPRLYCEAGFVAHRMGNGDEARRLIEQGRRLFGNFPPEPLKPYAAMCHYNRGLVLEAAGEIDAARSAYRTSLYMRPNRTVERHLTALPAPTDEPEVVGASSLEAMPATLDELYEVADEDEVYGPNGYDYEAVTRVELEVMAHRPASDGVPELALVHIGVATVMAIDQRVNIAVRREDGYELHPIFYDTDDMTDHGNTDMVGIGGGTLEVIDTTAGPIVRATMHSSHISGANGCDDECCYSWSATTDNDIVAFCTLGPTLCRSMDVSSEVSGDASSDCDDEEEEDGEGRSPWRRELTFDPDGTTHLRVVSGEPDQQPMAGDRSIAELLAATPRR